MHKNTLFLILLFVGYSIQSQIISKDFRSKIIEVKKDTIQLDSVAINSQEFKIFDISKKRISSTEFKVDFSKAVLIIDSNKYKNITIEYFRFPDFITKIYTPFNENLIINNNTNNGVLYSLTTNKKASDVKLFEGCKHAVLLAEELPLETIKMQLPILLWI